MSLAGWIVLVIALYGFGSLLAIIWTASTGKLNKRYDQEQAGERFARERLGYRRERP